MKNNHLMTDQNFDLGLKWLHDPEAWVFPHSDE